MPMWHFQVLLAFNDFLFLKIKFSLEFWSIIMNFQVCLLSLVYLTTLFGLFYFSPPTRTFARSIYAVVVRINQHAHQQCWNSLHYTIRQTKKNAHTRKINFTLSGIHRDLAYTNSIKLNLYCTLRIVIQCKYVVLLKKCIIVVVMV